MNSLKTILLQELSQDRVQDDVTTALLGTAAQQRRVARILSRQSGVFYGREVLIAMAELFPSVTPWTNPLADGDVLEEGTEVARLEGPAGDILVLERTLLNFLSHGCGVASLTRQFAAACGQNRTRILATRKTLPGLRDFQLGAVVAGGGHIHRRSLSDGILIKDNHRQLTPIPHLLERAHASRSPLHGVEIEVDSMEQLKEALEGEPTVVMLDNFADAEVQEALKLVNGRARVEVSGGVTLDRIPRLASLGVDYISVGRLTHSAASLDLGLDMENPDG